jgi:hypothetical protein
MMVPETPVASIVSAALARQSRNVPGPLSAVVVTVQVTAGRAIEVSRCRVDGGLAKLAASEIKQTDKRESATAMWSAEARAEVLSFLFIVVCVQSKSPESACKTDIFLRFPATGFGRKFN